LDGTGAGRFSQYKGVYRQGFSIYARRFIEWLFEAAEQLAGFPQLGRMVPEANYQDHIREIFFQNYRIIYLSQDKIHILAVIHGNRDLTNLPGKPWEVG
jgi:plasmid stabilization system protein ParE